MTVQINGTSGLVFQDGTTQPTAGYTGFRNRLINGDMRIDQRNAGGAITPLTGAYTVDRWGCFLSQASKVTCQQNAGGVTPPAGFTKYLGFTSSSAYTPLTNEIFGFAQTIEGYNIADLAWGTASAKGVTLSFWVRSSLTGTFGGFLKNGGVNVQGYSNLFYGFSYTINTANTWEYKTVTITAPTSGSWEVGNGSGLSVAFSLGAGPTATGGSAAWGSTFYLQPAGCVNVVATSGASLYVTGVQLEQGSSATAFESRTIGTELGLCKRYYQHSPALGSAAPAIGNYMNFRTGIASTFNSASAESCVIALGTTMRTIPTITAFRPTHSTGHNNSLACYQNGSGWYYPASAATTSLLTDSMFTIIIPSTAANGSTGITEGSWTAYAEL